MTLLKSIFMIKRTLENMSLSEAARPNLTKLERFSLPNLAFSEKIVKLVIKKDKF